MMICKEMEEQTKFKYWMSQPLKEIQKIDLSWFPLGSSFAEIFDENNMKVKLLDGLSYSYVHINIFLKWNGYINCNNVLEEYLFCEFEKKYIKAYRNFFKGNICGYNIKEKSFDLFLKNHKLSKRLNNCLYFFDLDKIWLKQFIRNFLFL